MTHSGINMAGACPEDFNTQAFGSASENRPGDSTEKDFTLHVSNEVVVCYSIFVGVCC